MNRSEALLKGTLDLLLKGIDSSAHGGSLARRNRPKQPQDSRQVTLLAEHFSVLRAKGLLAGSDRERVAEARAERGEAIFDGDDSAFSFRHGEAFERSLRGFGDARELRHGGERRGIVDRKLGEDLPVE